MLELRSFALLARSRLARVVQRGVPLPDKSLALCSCVNMLAFAGSDLAYIISGQRYKSLLAAWLS